MNRYVYRGIAEPPARPNAGGNVVRLGAVPASLVYHRSPIRIGAPIEAPIKAPVKPCPAWGCGTPPVRVITSGPGATSTVPQPAPPEIPWGGWYTSNPYPVPATPAPSPTVPVGPAQTAPGYTGPGTPLSSTGSSVSGWVPNTPESIGYAIVDANGNVQEVTTTGKTGGSLPNFNPNVGGTTSDGSLVWTNQGPSGSASASPSSLTNWLQESTLINGIPNWGLVAAAVGVWLMTKRK